jgi:two-component system, LytTR family, sensor histidine kinase LytS
MQIQHFTDLFLKKRWPWHVGFWLAYAASRAIPYYVTVKYYEQLYLEFMLFVEISFVILVYLTNELYRRFFKKTTFGLYFGISGVVWIGYVFGMIYFQKFYLRELADVAKTKVGDFFLNYLTEYVFIFVLLTLAKVFKDNFLTQQAENQRKQLQIQTELRQLKAQISPHFLFNTMNNFYGLAVEKSEKLPDLMVRLSSLLRYSLYETKNATVPLGQEIAYLQDYIELEKIRLEDSLDFEFDSTISAENSVEIAPLLLVVFVENAFKHAKNVTNDVIRIKISLALDTENTLFFEIKNNFLFDKRTDAKPGIGLENVQKRLEVLYPNGLHSLEIEQKMGFFWVKLRINLQKT